MPARRSTIQRKLILEELRTNGSHATAVELYEVVRQSLPRVSLGTIYRNLDILHQEGLVKKIRGSNRETRFDAAVKSHYHLYCSNCDRIEDLYVPVAVTVGGSKTLAQGWELAEPTVEFHGLCPQCRAGTASRTRSFQTTMRK